MRTVLVKIYKFDELSDKVKQKVIERFRETNDMPFLTDELKDNLKELLREYKIKIVDEEKVDLYYNLSHSQGDGVCFVGIFEYDKYHIMIVHRGRYSHYSSVEMSFEYIEKYRFDNEGNEQFLGDKEHNKVSDEFKSIYKTICLKLEKNGYDEIEYQNSEGAIKETIEANSWEFYEDGDIY